MLLVGTVSAARAVPVLPPLRTSSNVQLIATIPGNYAGIVFKDHYAFATGWAAGLTVFDITEPELPLPVGVLPLPHWENEDVALCGDTLLIANDQLGVAAGVLHVVDVSDPTVPSLAASLPLDAELGSGHIANFVTEDCSLVWVDGGRAVEVVDLQNPSQPRSLGSFPSVASIGPDADQPTAFRASHDTERDSSGTLWSVGGGGIAGYRLTDDPLHPRLVARSGWSAVNVDFNGESSRYNDFIMHNAQRLSRDVLLVTEEDYIDQNERPPGGCRGQGKFQTWRIPSRSRPMQPLDTWQTELNGFLTGGPAADSKAPVVVNCSSHWFDHRDGVVAVAWYEQGVRFLDVRDPSDIRQIGYHLPVAGATWAAYWVPNATDLVYTADATRGIDVLRIGNAADPAAPTLTAPIPAAWFGAPGGSASLRALEPSSRFGWSCPIPAAAG